MRVVKDLITKRGNTVKLEFTDTGFPHVRTRTPGSRDAAPERDEWCNVLS